METHKENWDVADIELSSDIFNEGRKAEDGVEGGQKTKLVENFQSPLSGFLQGFKEWNYDERYDHLTHKNHHLPD